MYCEGGNKSDTYYKIAQPTKNIQNTTYIYAIFFKINLMYDIMLVNFMIMSKTMSQA